jgi:Ser-tRNA(Ala) deacylase AlaX
MFCPYTTPQNGKVEHIVRSINNVVRSLLIQASLHRRYRAKKLHTATYLHNGLLAKTINVVCPHVATFGSAPSFDHL